MPRFSEERKSAVLKKLLPPHNRSVPDVAREEGISEQTLYDDTVPDGLCCYTAQDKVRTEKKEPCISKPEKEALSEPNCEMGVFLFSGDKYINGQ